MTSGSGGVWIYVVENEESGARERVLAIVSPEFVDRVGLPPEAMLGKLADGAESLDDGRFTPNRRFVDFLQRCLAEHAARHPELAAAAEQQGEARIELIDSRTPNPQGEVPEEDIFGSVRVADGVVAGYRANAKYKLRGTSGLLKLDPWFRARLLEMIEQLAG